MIRPGIRPGTWNTYHTGGYAYDAANDQASAGGVHLAQVRRHPRGGWQTRILQSNGRHQASGPVIPVEEREGWALFATAQGAR